MATTDKFVASYEDPDHIWPLFYGELKGRLPLGPVYPIVQGTGTPLPTAFRNLPSVDLEFAPASSYINSTSSKDILQAHRQPVIHLYLIGDEDVENYKASGKARLSAWHEAVNGRRKQQQCLVVIVSNGSSGAKAETKTNIFAAAQKSLADRIRTDFRCRVCQVRISPNNWGDLLETMGDAVFSGFAQQVFSLEDEIRRLEAQRQLPGWNYCVLFTTKESLALGFQIAGLYNDALQQYDQLEATFKEILVGDRLDKSNSWIDSECRVETERDLASFVDDKIRSEIYHNASNLFQFCSYLFARQLNLLLRLGKISELLLRGHKFISDFCYIPSVSLDDRSRWSYFHAVSLLSRTLETEAVSPTIELERAELCLLARRNLDLYAARVIPAFSRKHSLSLVLLSDADMPIADFRHDFDDNNLDLLSLDIKLDDLLADRKLFDRVYQQLTETAREIFSAAGFRRKEVGLMLDHATLHILYGRYQVALDLLRPILSDPAILWSDIEFGIRQGMVKCYKGLGDESAYLQESMKIVEKYHGTRTSSDIAKIFSTLLDLENDLAVSLNENVFGITVLPISHVNELCLSVENRFQFDLSVEGMSLVALSDSKVTYFETRGHITLGPGCTTVRLFSESIQFAGSYVLSSVRMRIGRISLETDYLTRSGQEKTVFKLGNDPTNNISVEIDSKVLIAAEHVIPISISANKLIEEPVKLLFQFRNLEPTSIRIDNVEIEAHRHENSIECCLNDLDNRTIVHFAVNGESLEDLILVSMESETVRVSKRLLYKKPTNLAVEKAWLAVGDERLETVKVEAEGQPTVYKNSICVDGQELAETLINTGDRQIEVGQMLKNRLEWAHATLNIKDSPENFIVGMLYEAKLDIQIPDVLADDFRYEVDGGNSWILCGKVKGFVSAKIETISLIPVKSGQLILPTLRLQNRDDTTVVVQSASNGRSVFVRPNQAPISIRCPLALTTR